MWKLLIADDEPKIRRGLKRCLKWDTLEIEIVGEAEDGEEALVKSTRLKPDIVLVDICMPFINGLELIKKLKTELPQVIIIIITGHDEFKYAQEAVRLSVNDYIMKPVDEEELKGAIINCLKIIEKKEDQNRLNKWSEKQIDNNKSFFREAFLKKWFNNEILELDAEKEMKYLRLSLSEYTGLMILKFDKNNRINLDRIITSIEAERFIDIDMNKDLLIKDDEENIVILSKIDSVSKWIEKVVIVHEKSKKVFDSRISVAYDTFNGIVGLKECYKRLKKELDDSIKKTPIVIKAKNYIDMNYYRSDLTLDEVASYMRINSSYLTRLIKKELGCSFSSYLTRVRIRKAILFLDDPSIKMYEIAESVGYNTQHYFSAAFKKVTGMSPLNYRNKERE